jgi:hypothetical protein
MSDVDSGHSSAGRMICGRASSLPIRDGTLITFDHAVNDLSSSDLLFIQSSDGADLLGLTLANERGKPPRLNYATTRTNLEYQLEQVDDRTWRLRSEPDNK